MAVSGSSIARIGVLVSSDAKQDERGHRKGLRVRLGLFVLCQAAALGQRPLHTRATTIASRCHTPPRGIQAKWNNKNLRAINLRGYQTQTSVSPPFRPPLTTSAHCGFWSPSPAFWYFSRTSECSILLNHAIKRPASVDHGCRDTDAAPQSLDKSPGVGDELQRCHPAASKFSLRAMRLAFTCQDAQMPQGHAEPVLRDSVPRRGKEKKNKKKKSIALRCSTTQARAHAHDSSAGRLRARA